MSVEIKKKEDAKCREEVIHVLSTKVIRHLTAAYSLRNLQH